MLIRLVRCAVVVNYYCVAEELYEMSWLSWLARRREKKKKKGMNEHEDIRRYLEYITDSLFSSAGINRSVFQKKDMKASLPPNYLNYISPFSMNEETRQVKTNLAAIVSSSTIDCNTQIQTLSKGSVYH